MARPIREIPWLKRRNDVFHVFWYDKAARRERQLSLRTRDETTAKNRYAAFLVDGKEIFQAHDGALTVGRALDDYLAEHVKQNNVAVIRAQYAMDRLRVFFEGVPMTSLDVPQCRAYAEARMAGRIKTDAGRRGKDGICSENTVKRELTVLRAAANHAAKWRRIGPSANPPTPMPTFELPSHVDANTVATWLTKDEIDVILDLSTGPLRDFILLAYKTAYRRATVENLLVSQIDFRTGRINPNTAGARRTVKRKAVVPIFEDIVEPLQRLVHGARDGRLFAPGVDFYLPFTRLLADPAYEGRRHPHVLRHSRATHMLMDGESIYKVARLLGDSVKTVEQSYGHYSVEYLNEAGKWSLEGK
jgi:integrase